MMLRADFGWIVFAAFLLWVVQVLRTGARGSGRGGGPLPRRPAGPLEGTQREGAELDELFRQLQQRLGGAAKTGQPRPRGVARQPAEARSVPPERVVERPEAAKVERPALVIAGESVSRQSGTSALAARLTASQLRDAVLWQEILGQPKGLQ